MTSKNKQLETIADDGALPEGWTLVEDLSGDAKVISPGGHTMPLLGFFEAQDTAETVLAEVEPTSWMDGDPRTLRAAIKLRTENRQILIAWIREALVEDTDWGRIHFVKKEDCPDGTRCTNSYHYSKPSLWKAGAEKIGGMLGLRAVWPELKDEMGHLKAGADVVGLRCQLINQRGEVVSEGIGARRLRQDYDDVNKSLKMAKKSGLIDAVLNAGGLSEVFTQDLIDDDNLDDNILAQLDDQGQFNLLRKAQELFPDRGEEILSSLARNRFRISSGNWREIPARRFVDAVRSLEEKAEEGLQENIETYQADDDD